MYKTETELGQALKQSGVARDKLYVTTKVMTNMADIPAALNTSLKKLGLDYVDLCDPSSYLAVGYDSALTSRADTSSMRLSSATRKRSISRNGSRWKNSSRRD